jgi:glycerol-3-phosphate acyltransferase PlsY
VYRPLLIFASYLIGTFPTAHWVVEGVAQRGSRNPGASNAFRLAGTRAGVLVLLGDAVKGALPTLAGLTLTPDRGRPLAMACGAAAVLGHCFPAPRRFKGGKGVATAAGMATVLYPLLAAMAAATWFAVARGLRKASLASLAAVVVLPVGTLLTGRPGWEVAMVTGVASLIVLRHAPNVGRLMRGEERSLR